MPNRKVCIPADREIEDVNGASARARLHDRNSRDLGVDERVSVPAHDSVNLRRELSGEVYDFSAAFRSSVPAAARSSVSDDDHEVGAALPERRSNAVNDWRRIVKPQSHDVGGARRRRSRDGGYADDSYSSGAALHDRVIANPPDVAAVGVSNVGAEDSELRLPHAGAEGVDSPVELVVAEGGRGVAHSIVVLHDGAAEGKVGGEGALEEVAGVEQ